MSATVNTDTAAKTVNAVDVPLAAISREALANAAQHFALAEAGEAADVAKAQRKFERAIAKAAVSKMDGLCAAALMLGDVHLSAAQYDAQVKDAVNKTLTASGISDVSSAAKRVKLVTLAMLCGIPALQPVGGEPIVKFLARVGPLLEWTPVEGAEPVPTLLPDGRPIWERNEDGSVRKPGSKTATPEAAAAREAAKAERAATLKTFTEALKPSAGAAADDEGGFNARRDIAAATILMGSADAATRLVTLLREHRDAYEKWATSTLAAAAEADKARKPKTPPAEPTREDRALNKAILDMANKAA